MESEVHASLSIFFLILLIPVVIKQIQPNENLKVVFFPEII
jgi:hypothetical protein